MTDIHALTQKDLASMIDQTLLKANATDEQLAAFCRDAAGKGYASVCLNAAALSQCAPILREEGVRVCAVVGFPLGQMTVDMKVQEALGAIQDGADEIDYVINIGKARSARWDYIEAEMRALVSACHERGVLVKVIFENCYLTDEEKKRLCAIARDVKPDFVKTSTGFGTGGATEEDVRLMRGAVGEDIGVKAAGGVRTTEDALKMIAAGATRIGASAGAQIVEGLKA